MRNPRLIASLAIAIGGSLATASVATATIYSNDFTGATALPHNDFNASAFADKDTTSSGIGSGVGGGEAAVATINHVESWWGIDAQTSWKSTNGNTETDLTKLKLSMDLWGTDAGTISVRLNDAGAGGDAISKSITLTPGEWTRFDFLLSEFSANPAFNPAAGDFQLQLGTRSWEGWSGDAGTKELKIDNIYYGAVPEPSTLGILGAGALFLVRRRRAVVG